MPELAIVWRNPKKVSNLLRYSPKVQIGDRHTYVVQQLLSVEHDLWVNTSVFEVISPRPVQATGHKLADRWHLSVGW